MRDLTPESVRQLYATLTQCYDMDLIEHWDGTRERTMGLLTLYLDAMRVPNVPQFLRQHHIDIDGSLYIPYAPGGGSMALIDQVTALAGALQRALYLGGCVESGALKYLLIPVERVAAELEAIRAELEVWSILRSPSSESAPPNLYRRLDAYGCSSTACELVGIGPRLDVMLHEIATGKVTTKAARDVLLFYGWDEK